MAEKNQKRDLSSDEEKIYKEILTKEMREKLKNKIEANDPNVIKTIKVLLEDSGKKKG